MTKKFVKWYFENGFYVPSKILNENWDVIKVLSTQNHQKINVYVPKKWIEYFESWEEIWNDIERYNERRNKNSDKIFFEDLEKKTKEFVKQNNFV